jgi:hypothetical protein
MFFFPNIPVLFGHIYLAYKKVNYSANGKEHGLLYFYSKKSYYDTFFDMITEVLFNNTRCFLHPTISYVWPWWNLWSTKHNNSLLVLYNQLRGYQLIYNYNSTMCNLSSMYQCLNSLKCISIHRLMDGINDCPSIDDETTFKLNNTDLIKQLEQTHYKCQKSNKFIHKRLMTNHLCEYEYNEDEEGSSFKYIKDIVFQTVCDGFIELHPNIIDGQNQTDETECDNKYTHCNYIWNCPNGRDEINCSWRPPSNCSLNDHVCVSPKTNQFMCLPIEKVNDGQIDCLGAFDEPQICRMKSLNYIAMNHFYCRNQTNSSCFNFQQLCNNYNNCQYGDDEQFCTTNRTSLLDYKSICPLQNTRNKSHVEKFLCDQSLTRTKTATIPFKIGEINILDTDQRPKPNRIHE